MNSSSSDSPDSRTDGVANVDAAEREKFDGLASSWWDPEGDSRPLHDINPARVRFIRERCTLDGAAAVDVGCGGGILSEALAREGATVTGLDVAERALRVARLHLHESGLKVDYRPATAEQYASEMTGQADLVACMELLEHVPDPRSVVHACANMVRPGGDLFLSTLNRTPAAFALAIVGAEHLARLVPRGTHRYDRFLRPSELASWLREIGMEVLEITGLHYNPISRSASLGGPVGVNYLVHARRGEAGS